MNIFLLRHIHREGTWSFKLSTTEKKKLWPFRSDKTKEELLADLTNVALKLGCPFEADTLTLRQVDFTRLKIIGIRSLRPMNLFVLSHTRPTWSFRVKDTRILGFRSELTEEELLPDLSNIALKLGCDFKEGRDALTLKQVEPFTNLREI